MSYSALEDQQKAFALVAMASERSRLSDLIPFLPDSEQEIFEPVWNEFNSKEKPDRKQFLLKELPQIQSRAQWSPIGEIHSDWIWEKLKSEPPRVIATLLRYLPGEQVQKILGKMSKEELANMPAFKEAFSIDPELISVMRLQFEAQFEMDPPLVRDPAECGFDDIPKLPFSVLEKLFKSLGFWMLGLAFSILNEQTVKSLLLRLPQKDAGLVKLAMLKLGEVSPERAKLAQSHLVSLQPGKAAPELLIWEAGIFIYSKGIEAHHLPQIEKMRLKFPLGIANLITRHVQANLSINTPQSVVKYQEEVVSHLHQL